MENTWASGALELLRHADSHLELGSAFDSRIAFISIDNSVETSVRTFLSLPEKLSGFKFPRKEKDEAGNSFPKMVELLFKYASSKLIGLDEGDIEHYHRIRNQLYHDGTGLSVDSRYLKAYRQIAAVLLNNLFGVETEKVNKTVSIENLILLWNQLESSIHTKFKQHNISAGHTFKWEQLEKTGEISWDQFERLTKLRMIRNHQVHSTTENFDYDQLETGVRLAEALLGELNG
ncbi:hypothetical protein [Vibrio parahaemolyticus]|uniref:hypothetical protein n=1 Tax=Vibrio parahaemolyticus TaxID=670 RepID=UPI0003F9B4F2|nr:hypothetical protein [Vibrio parahaemolyticus]EGQ8195847.1 hypothetical protein [Vibrio parahaemolyticus]MCQ9044423.1 hypothetical protein [Vibrio parahaemolyticus]MDF4269662.1 hypothetical protein [Vibrio parahaemolyticus]MDF4274960.1 hypothetical protein [Vibrio parahaemolyticus]MDF4299590.1 hypothetical protein [Vibrio parahaemolyticus]